MIRKVGAWGKTFKTLLAIPARVKAASHIAVMREAHLMRREIVQGIGKGAPGGKKFTPLSPLTIATRRHRGFRGTKILQETGTLKNSITVVSPRKGTAFVGVLRSATGKDGRPLINIAQVHEFGSKAIVIRKTPEMIAMLHIMFRKAGVPEKPGTGRSVIVIKIPPRPFLQPVFDKLAPGAGERVQQAMIAALRGVLS